MDKIKIIGGTPLKGHVRIGGAKNAAILAAKILAVSDEELLGKLKAMSEKMKAEVMAKDAKLQAEME